MSNVSFTIDLLSAKITYFWQLLPILARFNFLCHLSSANRKEEMAFMLHMSVASILCVMSHFTIDCGAVKNKTAKQSFYFMVCYLSVVFHLDKNYLEQSNLFGLS